MAQRERLRAMLNERLASTGEGICDLFEGKIREYEQEVNFLNQEYNLRQKLLEAAIKREFPVVLCEDEAGSSDSPASPPSPQIKQEAAEEEENNPQQRKENS